MRLFTGIGITISLLAASVTPAQAQVAPHAPTDRRIPSFYEVFGDPSQSPPVAEDVPFRGEIRAVWPREPFPVAFHPLPDGRVILLDGARDQVVVMNIDRELRRFTPSGGTYDPSLAHLVDVMPGADGQFLVLDSGAGTIWQMDDHGVVNARLGLFVAATHMARGADGNLYVQDPGNQAVVGIDPRSGEIFSRKGAGHTCYANREGMLPFLRNDPQERHVTVGLIPARGTQPTASLLARLEPPPGPGNKVLEARVIGVHEDELFVRLYWYRDGDERPRGTELHAIVASGPARGQTQSWTLPTPTNYCIDCGPAFRIGPEGDLWGYVTNLEGYRVIRYRDRGRQP